MYSLTATPNTTRPEIAMIARAACVVAKPGHEGQADRGRTGRQQG